MNFWNKLTRVKDVDAILSESKSGHRLKRTLTWVDLIFMGIGAIIGAGIFATIGTAAAGDMERLGAGPALALSFILTGVACGFSAFCYAEFAAMVPIAGSAYTYSYATLGELIAWIIGWDLIIEYAIGNVAVAISWSGYFQELLSGFGVHLPMWMCIDYRSALARGGDIIQNAPHLLGFPIVFNLPAVAIVVALTVLIVIGIKESAKFNLWMVGTKLVVLTFFCAVGLFYVRPENYVPFAPNGFSGILTGASIVFFAYIGFDAVSTLAEETKDPGVNLPKGIIGSLLICTIIYVVVTVIFCGLIPFTALKGTLASEKAEPLTMALKYVGKVNPNGFFSKGFLDLAAGIVAFGSVIAHTAVLLVFQIGQPRIFYSMSRDGLLPKFFMRVHPVYKTPAIATIFTGVVVAFFAAFMNIDEMVDLCNIGTLFAFVLVCIGIIILRVRDPERHRPFKVPGGITIPVLGVLSCGMLIYGLTYTTWIRFFLWLFVGLGIYFLYGIRHSRLNPDNAILPEEAAHGPADDVDKF
ncbi:MAG TPA: amino acid permease [Candidatus Ozemobacteraceae bacterium]|nr:amino acid permease [Candidatus Ozemobacteraceae bacterium]